MSAPLNIDVTKFNPSLFGEDEDESNNGIVSEISVSPNDSEAKDARLSTSPVAHFSGSINETKSEKELWNERYRSDEEGNESSNMATPPRKYCGTLTSSSQSESEKEEKNIADGSPDDVNHSVDDEDDEMDDSDIKKEESNDSYEKNYLSDDEDDIPLQVRVQKQSETGTRHISRKRKRNELSDELSKDPDLYGIRRSGRIKDNQIRQKEIATQRRIAIEQSRMKNSRRNDRHLNHSRHRNSWSSMDDESEDDSSDSSSDRRTRKKKKNVVTKRKQKYQRPQRISGGRACTAGKTYKEVSTSDDFSEDEPGIDDITENSEDDDSSQSQTDYSAFSNSKQKRGKSSRDLSVASAYYKPSNKIHPLLQSGGKQTSHFGQSALNKTSSRFQNSGSTSFSRVRRLSFVGSQRSDDVGDDDGTVEDSVSTGRFNQHSNYGYSSDIDIIDRVVDYRLGRKNAVGDPTTIYLMRQRTDPNEGFNAEAEKGDAVPQYLIKWKDWSHLHNTWESMESLFKRQAEGLKKVDKFNQKLKELSEWKMSASPEEIEEYNYQEEQNMHLYEQYRTVERVILHRDEGSDGTEYQVKWMGLPYAESSWEAGWVVEDLFPQQVEDYRIRSKSTNLPTPRGSSNTIQMRIHKHRSTTRSFKEQPKYIGNSDLRLRDYQLEGVNFLLASFLRNRSVILADEMGLGKTIQTIGFLSVLYKELNIHGPFLLVVPLSTVASWQKEFAQWAPFMNTICYLGDRLSREKIRMFEWYVPNNRRALRFNACITTYEILMADRAFLSQVHWATLAVDEAHRLKNDESILYQHLFNFTTHYRLLITGTPLQNSLRELWALLHFLMPLHFTDWKDFNENYSIEKASDCADLWKVLVPYILRRVKKQVESSLPAKVEKILRVELSRKQKQYYKWILTKNYDALSKGVKGSITGFVNIVMELKKLCNHPQLVRREEEVMDKDEKLAALIRDSGKMLLLDKLLLRLRTRGHRVLIFSQMVRMLDLLEDYLHLRGWHFQRLDGSVRGDLRKTALDHFNAENSADFVFLLSTRAGGLGINLATADTVIIFDSDWNPQNDLQAQARAHRIGQTKQVSVYRFVQTGSVEETIIERAKKKMVLDQLVIQRMDTTGRTVLNKKSADRSQPFNKEELNQILKFGAEEMFKETEGEETECPELNIDDVLNEAETRDGDEETNKNSADELLSFFQVHNFSYDDLEDETNPPVKTEPSVGKSWDDIIPEEDIKLKREEENQAFLERLNLGPRNRKQTKLFNYGQDDNDDDDDDDDDDDNENDGVKRGKMLKDKDLRALVRSMRRFPRPLDRVDAIMTVSERLQELSVTKVKAVIEDILQKCNETVSKWNEEEEQRKHEPKDSPVGLKDDESSKMSGTSDRKPKKPVAPTIEIGQNVTVNAKQIVQSVSDLEPLAKAMPSEHAERLKYKLPFNPKPVSQWKMDWSTHDDAQLLIGVYEHGMDSWDSIKMDPELSLMDKILPPNGKHRPQANHLKTRIEYLIKLLGQYQLDPTGITTSTGAATSSNRNNEKKSSSTKKRSNNTSNAPPRKKPEIVIPSGKSREFIEDSDISSLSSSSSDSDVDQVKRTDMSSVPKKSKTEKKDTGVDSNEKMLENKKKRKREDTDASESATQSSLAKKIKKEPSTSKNKKKAYSGPMHFTTHEPVSVKEEKKVVPAQREEHEDETLSPERFKELKDVMRPVRKILKRLETCDLKDESNAPLFLLRLGNHIRDIYHRQKTVEEVRRWRNDLWQFVSFFVDCSKEELHNLYKRTFKQHKTSKGESESSKRESSKRRHSRSSDDKKDTPHRDVKSHNHHQRREHSRDRDRDRDRDHRDTEHGKKSDAFQSHHQDQSNHRYDSYDSTSRFHSHYQPYSHNSSLNSDLHRHHHGRDTSDFYRSSGSSQRHQRPNDSYNRPPQHWTSGSDCGYTGYGGGYGSDSGRWRHGGGGGGNNSGGSGHRGPPTDAYNSYRRPGQSVLQRSRWS